jgi:hypothetical protein
MTDYVELPSQQLRNLVKRYIQFRKAAEIESKLYQLTILNLIFIIFRSYSK